MEALDTSVFDDPDLLIGTGGETVDFRENRIIVEKLKTLAKVDPPWREPPKKGIEILRKWLKSQEGKDWCSDWDYLARLKIDDYIWLYSRFPEPFLEKFIGKAHKGHEIYQAMKDYYQATSSWLLWLVHRDQAKPPELKEQELIEYELESQISRARLGLCIATGKFWSVRKT